MGDFTVNVSQKPMDFNRWQLGLFKQLISVLEARPEAGFRLPRHIVAVTALDTRRVEVAVGQLRQVFGPMGRKPEAPRQANIKVWIEDPQPVAPHFVVDALANAALALRRQHVDVAKLPKQGSARVMPPHESRRTQVPQVRPDPQAQRRALKLVVDIELLDTEARVFFGRCRAKDVRPARVGAVGAVIHGVAVEQLALFKQHVQKEAFLVAEIRPKAH